MAERVATFHQENLDIIKVDTLSPVVSKAEERAVIAQMSSEEYIEFLKIIKKIHTEFIYIISCFAGGINLLKMHNILIEEANKKLDKTFSITEVPFTIVIGTTSGTESTYAVSSKPNDSYLRDFFNALDLYLKFPRSYLKKPLSNKKNTTPPTLIQDVLKPLYTRLPYSTNYPIVRFPGSNTVFRPTELDDLFVITYIGLQSYVLAKKQGTIKSIAISSNIKDILVYPAIIQGIDICLEAIAPATIPTQASPTISTAQTAVPHIVSKIEGNAQHFFDTIEAVNIDLFNLVYNGFCANLRRGREKTAKSWFIKQVFIKDSSDLDLIKENNKDTSNPLLLKDLIIYKSTDSNVEVLLNYNGKFFASKSTVGGIGYTISIKAPKEHRTWMNITKDQFIERAKEIYQATKPLEQALKHASGGNETSAMIQEAFDEFLTTCK